MPFSDRRTSHFVQNISICLTQCVLETDFYKGKVSCNLFMHVHCAHTCACKHIRTYEPTDIHAYHIYKHTDRQTDRQIDRQTDIHTHPHTHNTHKHSQAAHSQRVGEPASLAGPAAMAKPHLQHHHQRLWPLGREQSPIAPGVCVACMYVCADFRVAYLCKSKCECVLTCTATPWLKAVLQCFHFCTCPWFSCCA